jgi:hypothetical protein
MSNPGNRASSSHDRNQTYGKGKNARETGQTPFIYSILVLAMTKRKPGTFSVTKAVKANARERVGQPPPARVLDSEPRTGRDTKHKPTLEETIRQEE